MPTTYVLGAGASRDAGYPFAKDMGHGLLCWMERAEPEGCCDFSESASFLRENFTDADDIEELLKQIKDVRDSSSTFSTDDRDRLSQLNWHFSTYMIGLCRWFEQIHSTSLNTSYRLFASEVVKPGDTIITFNYDVSLDRELKRAGVWEAGDGYGFSVEGLPASSKVSLLKLHGSINWKALLFGGGRSGAVNPVERSLGSRPVFFDES